MLPLQPRSAGAMRDPRPVPSRRSGYRPVPAWASACALFLALAASAFAQKTDSAEGPQEHGFPWIAHSSIDIFYLPSPAIPGKDYPYQASLYQAFTIQSLSFAWFHLGLRSRETLAPGFSQAYREPLALKLQGSAEVIQDYLWVTLGGNIPMLNRTMDLSDTLALYQVMNGYNPMPYAAFLSPQALHASIYGRYAWTNWTLLTGVSYVRPALFSIIPDKSFFPAPYFDLDARAIYQGRAARHRFDLKGSFFADEGNDIRIPAHNEGDLIQFRYGYLKSLRHVGWQAGAGSAVKLPDANRRLKLKSELAQPDRDDNLQRLFAEFSLAWAPDPDIIWRLHLLPKALFTWNGEQTGHETETGLSVGLKIWEYHRLRLTGTMLYGQVADETYTGFGFRGEFAFRHLGFQDIDDGSDQGDPQ
ncbi:MAG: hypothetical protein JWP91_4420 [Fibrobacteres bacterium]|nr:hypothetical protein [Fibrobacterota bacterium]